MRPLYKEQISWFNERLRQRFPSDETIAKDFGWRVVNLRVFTVRMYANEWWGVGGVFLV